MAQSSGKDREQQGGETIHPPKLDARILALLDAIAEAVASVDADVLHRRAPPEGESSS